MIECSACQCIFNEPQELSSHLNLHKNSYNGSYSCPLCDYHQGSTGAFQKHLKRYHSSHSESETETFTCNICGVKLIPKDIISHHGGHLDGIVQIGCPFDMCDSKFFNVNSFKAHCARKHTNRESHNLDLILNESSSKSHSIVEAPVELSDHSEETVGKNIEDFTSAALMFYMKLEVELLVPLSSVQYISQKVKELSDLSIDIKTDQLNIFLKDKRLDTDIIKEIVDFMKNGALATTHGPGGAYSTTYLRKALYKKFLKYVVPVSLPLGKNTYNENSVAVYIPLKESLKVFLSNNGIESREKLNSGNEVYDDISSGKLYTEKNGFDFNIMMYMDEFEIVNPIGSAKNKHKILAFYYTLCELPQHERQNSEKIQLILMVNSNDAKKFDKELYLGLLIRDLKDLESEGLDFEGKKLKVSLHCILGDNLGSNWVGGFVENFSANIQSCRFCLINKDGIQEKQDFCLWRTPESYNEALKSIPEGSHNQGIKFDSLFNALDSYHCCAPGLPPCIAHDLLEGIVTYDLYLFISHFVKVKKWFTWEILNRKFQTFIFQRGDSYVRPSVISPSKSSLGGTASQNWTLLRFFALVMQNYILDSSDVVWQALVLLQLIVEFVFAHKLHLNQICQLHRMILDYMDTRKSEFPDVPLRPKHHFITHYPYLITKFGPLIHYWTLNFEKKHQYFKRIMRRSSNYINVLKMLSEKHELFQSYLTFKQEKTKTPELCNTLGIDHDIYSKPILDAMIEYETKFNDKLIGVMSKATQCNTEYVKGMILPLMCSGEVGFGELKLILLSSHVDKSVVFLFKLYKTSYVEDMNLYCIDKCESYKCIAYKDLPSYHPLKAYSYKTEQAVVLKYRPVDLLK